MVNIDMDKMKAMMDSGVTVLFVSHDINAIRRLCTRALWLRDGKVQTFGDTNRVCDMYMDYLKTLDNDAVQTGEPTGTQIEGIKEFSKGSKATIAEIAGIRLLNSQGKSVSEIEWNRPLTVEVYYDVYDENVETPVLGVALKRVDDEYICGVNTLLDHEKIPWKYGRNCYRLNYQDGIGSLEVLITLMLHCLIRQQQFQ